MRDIFPIDFLAQCIPEPDEWPSKGLVAPGWSLEDVGGVPPRLESGGWGCVGFTKARASAHPSIQRASWGLRRAFRGCRGWARGWGC